jgi:hypothetical protein
MPNLSTDICQECAEKAGICASCKQPVKSLGEYLQSLDYQIQEYMRMAPHDNMYLDFAKALKNERAKLQLLDQDGIITWMKEH